MTSKERHEARYQRRKLKREKKNAERSFKYANFSEALDFDSLWEAYVESRKGVRWKASVQIFESKLAINLRRLEKKLIYGKWKSNGFYTFFIIERGKLRFIQSVDISERCIQRALCDNVLIPIISPHLIYDNGASMKNKGTDFALSRLVKHLKYYIDKNGTNGWIVFYDFSSFFQNVNNDILCTKVGKLIQDPKCLKLYMQLIYAFGQTGLGLGSQVSQISAIYYPNEIDHLIKDELGIKGYGRYMDDGYIIVQDETKLYEVINAFKGLCSKLDIKLNSNKFKVLRINKPFRFLKVRFHVTKSGQIVRRQSNEAAKKERNRLKKFRELYDCNAITADDVYNAFNSWIFSQNRGKCYWMKVRMIRFYNNLFSDIGPYFPKDSNKIKNRRRRKVVWHMAKNALERRRFHCSSCAVGNGKTTIIH